MKILSLFLILHLSVLYSMPNPLSRNTNSISNRDQLSFLKSIKDFNFTDENISIWFIQEGEGNWRVNTADIEYFNVNNKIATFKLKNIDNIFKLSEQNGKSFNRLKEGDILKLIFENDDSDNTLKFQLIYFRDKREKTYIEKIQNFTTNYDKQLKIIYVLINLGGCIAILSFEYNDQKKGVYITSIIQAAFSSIKEILDK